MVYHEEVGIAICTEDEIKWAYGGGGEAGQLLKRLMDYLEKLKEGK
jgi:hypothetical protein